MNLGDLYNKIQIQSPPTGKDTGGELSGSWSHVCSPWASVKHVSSAETKDEGTEAVADTLNFTIRYRSGISSEMRILYDGKIWQITGIKPIGRDEYLEIATVHKTNW